MSCLYKMDIENAVTTIVEAMLPRFSGMVGLSLQLILEWTDYDKEGKGAITFRRRVDLLYLREHNYTKLFSREVPLRGTTLAIWRLATDHDSGWTYGVDKVIEDVHKEAREFFGEAMPTARHAFSAFYGPYYVHVIQYQLREGEEVYGGLYDVDLGMKLEYTVPAIPARPQMKDDAQAGKCDGFPDLIGGGRHG